MRPRHLIHTDMFKAIGGFCMVASLCRVEEGTVRKWTQDPGISGRDIPVTHLEDVLREAGRQITNLNLQNHVDEYLNHLLTPCHRRALLNDQVFAMVEMLNGTNPASSLARKGMDGK